MNIDLKPQLVQSRVDSGRYHSAGDAVTEALRLLQRLDEALLLQREQIRQQVEDGWQSAQRGAFVDGDAFFDRLDAELEIAERAAAK